MRRAGAASILLLVFTAGALATPPRVGPGGKVGTMTLVRGAHAQADKEIWAYCDPVVLKPGRYHRVCSVPRARRLYIGYGGWERTRTALDAVWSHTKWELWLDGTPVGLSSFGSGDRTLYAYPPAGGKNVILREWSVILLRPTTGRHVLRYRSVSSAGGTYDVTWTFPVG